MNELLTFTIVMVIVAFLFGIAVVACIYVLSSVLTNMKSSTRKRKESR